MRGDGDVQAGFSVSQQYFHVLLHLLTIAAGNGAEPLVAGAGLQGKARDGRQQAIQRQGIVIAEYIKRFLLYLRQQIVQLDQTLPVAGQHRAAAALSAGGAIHQRLFAELVHLIDGIPSALIADARMLRPLAYRTGLVNLFEQGDPPRIGKQALL